MRASGAPRERDAACEKKGASCAFKGNSAGKVDSQVGSIGCIGTPTAAPCRGRWKNKLRQLGMASGANSERGWRGGIARILGLRSARLRNGASDARLGNRVRASLEATSLGRAPTGPQRYAPLASARGGSAAQALRAAPGSCLRRGADRAWIPRSPRKPAACAESAGIRRNRGGVSALRLRGAFRHWRATGSRWSIQGARRQ